MENGTLSREAIDAAHAELGTDDVLPPTGEEKALEAFREEAGEAVGPMPPREPLSGGPVEELRVDGTTQLGMFDAGGKKPGSASLRLTGGKVGLVDGRAFRKGDVIRLEVVAVVREVGQRDKPDSKTGIVVEAEQKHTAQITDLRILESLDGAA